MRIGLHQSVLISLALLCSQSIGTAVSARWRSALWAHALCTAALCHKIARELGSCEPNDAYLGGLIYDIGLMAVECVQGGTLDALEAAALAEGRTLREVEDERVGAVRDELARHLLTNWSVPSRIIDAVCTRALPKMQRDSMPAVLWCADRLARARPLVEAVYADDEPPFDLAICSEQNLPEAFRSVCSLSPIEVQKIQERVAGQVQALRAMASMFAHVH